MSIEQELKRIVVEELHGYDWVNQVAMNEMADAIVQAILKSFTLTR